MPEILASWWYYWDESIKGWWHRKRETTLLRSSLTMSKDANVLPAISHGYFLLLSKLMLLNKLLNAETALPEDELCCFISDTSQKIALHSIADSLQYATVSMAKLFVHWVHFTTRHLLMYRQLSNLRCIGYVKFSSFGKKGSRSSHSSWYIPPICHTKRI